MNIINIIDDYLTKKEPYEMKSHHPSEAEKCSRQLWYKWQGAPETNPPLAGAFWKMEIGNAIHELVFDLMKKSGLDRVEQEVVVKEKIEGLKYPISGRMDNTFIDNGEVCGIEIKTSFGRGIVDIQKTQEPKPEALTQIAFYLTYTDMKKFYLVYVGRDNAYRCQFIVTLKDGFLYYNEKKMPWDIGKYIKKFSRIENATTKPAREYKIAIKEGEIKAKFQKNKVEYKSDWQCNYCEFRDHCWNDVLIKAKIGEWHGEQQV